MKLAKYSMGIGDRFGRQGNAQLAALIQAKKAGLDIDPVWNKSNREHTIIGTSPADVRKEADQAVAALGWKGSYFVDADHINLTNVDAFIESSDFFTLDVADFISKEPAESELADFVRRNKKYARPLDMPGMEEKITVTENAIAAIGKKFLAAVKEAAKIYHHIRNAKANDDFITEVSMDESDQPQNPTELLFILEAIAHEGVPAQTIAPKFTGRFNKGVDYVGDIQQFEKEFNDDIAVINFAVHQFGLPPTLKLSIHSGSDKFSIYGPVNEAIKKFDAGLHLKTAGTTWLEELIGLAEAQGEGLALAKEIYEKAFAKFDELCAPYSTVIDIDRADLPAPEQVNKWPGRAYADALRHDQSCPAYNKNFRQLLHVAYKIAAQMGTRYLDMLEQCREKIAKNVTENLFLRHLKPLFGP
jgi:hypothetical protein